MGGHGSTKDKVAKFYIGRGGCSTEDGWGGGVNIDTLFHQTV